MSKYVFTDNEIETLNKNKNVKRVSNKSITYSDDFKLQFIADYENGMNPGAIFAKAGFDVEMLGKYRIQKASDRWRKAYKDHGVSGLQDTRRLNSGRPRTSELSLEEVVEKQKAEIEYLKAEVELLKKLELEERQVIKGKLQAVQIYGLIEAVIKVHKLKKTLKYLCELAEVSRSGYYHYLKTKELRDKRYQQDLGDYKVIKKAFDYKGCPKGSRGITMTLKNEFGIIFNRKRVQRIMRKFGIVCPIRKPNPYKRMAKATKEHRVVPNILQRNFKQTMPAKVLLTDITYMPYQGGIAYLSAIKDSASNEILAYNLSKDLKLHVTHTTIKNLLKNYKKILAPDAYIHSDQGVHYTHPQFQKLLKQNGLGQSMSRRGNCWDNAPMESFFGHMKDEIDYKNCSSFEELSTMVDQYMYYYNHHRYQWGLKKLTPVMYRSQLYAA